MLAPTKNHEGVWPDCTGPQSPNVWCAREAVWVNFAHPDFANTFELEDAKRVIVIATDEAGYGPKLGPLVVGATAWHLPETAGLEASFEQISKPVDCDGLQILVDDSKSIFRPRSGRRGAGGNKPGYRQLEWVVLAACHWCGLSNGTLCLARDLVPDDYDVMRATDWLKEFGNEVHSTQHESSLIQHWQQGAARLIATRARVVTAERFNARCQEGLNKADLLAETTLSLVRGMFESIPSGESDIRVFCDRFGGRRFYAPPIQNVFENALVSVISETRSESAYRVPFKDGSFEIRFTVKGDTFAPVAFSSMIAKYLREKSMESFNRYFESLWDGDRPLRPTAGYPVDADRFLADIQPVVDRENLDLSRLVRSR